MALADASAKREHAEAEENPLSKKRKLGDGVWTNLDLILSIQNEQLPLQRKIELAFDFISKDQKIVNDTPNSVSISRFVLFLSDWIQSVLISDQNKKSSELSDLCLDFRCWAILRFFVDSSSVGISPNLLRAVTRFARHALNGNAGYSVQLIDQASECLSVILSSNSRAFYNVGVELWVSCTMEIVSLLRRIVSDDNQVACSTAPLSKMSILVVEHFSNFLRFHPNPKNVFRVFVDRLLEPLLEFLVLLHLKGGAGKSEHVGSLVKMVEEVLSNGLFHPAHIGGFSSLRGSSVRQEVRESKGINESYHRHFFRRLEKIIAEKKAMALCGLGYLLRMFVSRVKVQKLASLSFKHEEALREGAEASEEAHATSKPLFDMFVQFMEPLLFACKRFTDTDLSGLGGVSEIQLVEVHGMLRSVNETLASFLQERIYVRSEDTSEGAHCSFLTEVCGNIISIADRILVIWLSDGGVQKILALIAKEVLVALGYMLEIEYKAVGDDLAILWLVLLSFSALSVTITDKKPFALINAEISKLGCQVINVYGELRQVHIPIFALCKAIRFLTASDAAGIVEHAKCIYASTLSSDICLESVTSLLWSHEVQLAASNAVKSIPEGQASGCIQHLTVDFMDSLEWMRLGSVGSNEEELGEAENLKINLPKLDLQAELLGRFLSEIYTILLDSLTVTATNCVFIGNSMKNLMKNIRSNFRYLVQDQPDRVDEFCFSVIGCKLTKDIMAERDGHLWINPKSMTWILVFYFRIYVSCRSLYRQSISLMPPDSSQKASAAMGSSFIMACGVDWKEMSDCMDEGFFSWVVKSSISLVDVINSVSEHYLSNNPGRYAPLVYVLHIMALQRLVDLNRHIKSYEFFHERDVSLVQMESDTHMQKMCKKWKRLLKVSRKEAAELTNFMIGYMPPLVSRGWLVNKDGTSEVSDMFLVYEDEWDLGACSLIEKSLPVAIWWLLCQNVDVWCTHATKKALKQFCSRLLHYSLPCISNSTTRYSNQLAKYQLLQSRKVTMHLISLEFLSNTVSYEQKVLLKLFPAKFCFVLKNIILPLLSSDLASNADLCSAAEWSEVMNVLDKKPVVFIDSGDALHDLSSPPPSDNVFLKICDSKHKRQSVSSLDMALEACESLLKLLGQMLHVYFDAKSFITYTTCILNLEKHLVSKLSSYRGDSSTYVPFEILRLFMSCRRTLKCLLMASIEDSEVRQSLFSSVLFSNSLSMSWAVKSVYQVVGLPCGVFEKKYANQVNELIFSLMENTSYVFFAVISGQTTAAMPFLLDDKEPETESMMIHVSEILSEQIEDILFILKSDKLALKKEDGISVLNWNAISSVISCSQGFFWGFTSAIDNMYKDCSSENLQPSRSICRLVSKLISFMGVFEEFINLCLNILLTDHGQENKISYNKCDFADLICEDGPSSSNVLNMDISMGGIVTDKCGGRDDKNTEQALENDCTKISKVKKRKSSSSHTNYAGTVLHGFQKFDLSKTQHPKETLLQSLLRGENPQIAFVLKQVFVSCAAILQLKCLPWFHRATESQISCSSSELSSTYILLSTSRVVLQEMAKMSDRPEPYTFFWLSGILNYLEVLGSYFNMTNPDLSKNLYAELIDIHLKAIGKCISLQGKAATLSSHETNSNTKMLEMQGGGSSELEMLVPDHCEYSINAFKVRLRKSFQKLVKRPLRLHLLTAVKALERALVGVHKSSNMIYEITTGSLGGGMVSSYVAAGVDCLDLVLEIVPGTKQVIRRNISSLVSALFNIVLHLQSSSIFFLEKCPLNEIELNPHPGMVILMCVGVLTKVVGGRSYKMSPHHIGQCLHLPTALFHKFRRLNVSSIECHNWAFSTNQDARQLKGKLCHCVDNQFSVDLYAACCRLLSTTLRHQKWEAGRCVALVEDSVSILLSSLEMADVNFAWGLQEAVKCASFFRRIYEEIRHQKDIFARHAAHFLSSYITTYSGYGPLKLGIKKEVDEALRPGVYALIDICSPTDLQRLHTVLGEGPCRSTLANLQHDYRLNFQYEGKI